MPTFASKVTCVAKNPIDPSIIALGSGDGLIRVWKTNAAKVMFDFNTIWQKGGPCEILALAWNPSRDNCLAFATNEGRIGMVDALSPRPYPTIFDFKHRQSVYNLVYGPIANLDSADEEQCLYSLGDGAVFMHCQGKHKNIEEIIKEVNNLQDRKSPSRSEMIFQPRLGEDSSKYLAIGSDDGTIEIFSMPDLKLVCTLKSFQKLIQSMDWRRNSTSEMLAVGSNEYEIHVWSLAERLSQDKNVYIKPDIVLEGHKLRVIQVAWNPLNDSELLSVSYDGTAQVWQLLDDNKGQGKANFRGHGGCRVFCGLWSDQDTVMSGGEDNAVHIWKPSK